MLEWGIFSTLFPCENCVSFSKEYFLQVRHFKHLEGLILFQIGVFSCVEEEPVSLEKKKTICVRMRNI
jgi:hypothetical protein